MLTPQPQQHRIWAASATYTTARGRILNPVSEARGWTCNLMVPSRIRFRCAMTGTLYPLSFQSLEKYKGPYSTIKHHWQCCRFQKANLEFCSDFLKCKTVSILYKILYTKYFPCELMPQTLLQRNDRICAFTHLFCFLHKSVVFLFLSSFFRSYKE